MLINWGDGSPRGTGEVSTEALKPGATFFQVAGRLVRGARLGKKWKPEWRFLLAFAFLSQRLLLLLG